MYPNCPSFNDDIVYAMDLGDEQNKELIQAYPGRNYYRWVGGTTHLTPYNPLQGPSSYEAKKP
jgi:hypothetical protein